MLIRVVGINARRSKQSTTIFRSSCRCALVNDADAVKVCPFTVADVMRVDAFGSVKSCTDSAVNSLRILAHAVASEHIAL